MIEVDCRKCKNLGNECLIYGKDADKAVDKCAKDRFRNYKKSTRRPFDRLTNDEVYMLSRALIESSYVIMICDEKTDSRYSTKEKEIHNKLLNMVSDERKYRGF